MALDVAGLGNALMDALVIIEDDALLEEFELVRGTMHPVDHQHWAELFARVRASAEVTFDSGGSCANTIATVGRLGGHALYCGQVGDDDFGDLYAQHLSAHCGQHSLRVAEGLSTGKCLSLISRRDAERTMATDLGASILLPSLGSFADELAQAKIAHFTGYTLLAEPMRGLTLKAIEQAAAAGTSISLDVADPFVVQAIHGVLDSLIETQVRVLFLNAEEARGLTGHPPTEALEHLVGRGKLETIVVKLGKQGSRVWHQGTFFDVPVFEVTPVDTTGAGDAYAGGFLFGMSRGWPAPRCGALATRVAGLTVSQLGAVVKDSAALRAAIEATQP